MLRNNATTISALSRGVDLACVAIAFIAAATWCGYRDGIGPLLWMSGASRPGAVHSGDQYVLLLVLSLVVWEVMAQWNEAYRSHRGQRLWPLVRTQMKCAILWAVLLGCLVFVFKLSAITRPFFLRFFPIAALLLIARQIVIDLVLRWIRAKGYNQRGVVVLGDPARAALFSKLIQQEAASGFRLVPGESVATDGNNMVWRPSGPFDEAFLVIGPDSPPEIESLALSLLKQGKRINIVPGLFDVKLFRQSLDEFAGVPVVSVGGPGLDEFQALAKRLMDLVGSALLAVMLAPVMAVVALLVRLSSPGPVLFSQERLGQGGRRFFIYKFRTMYADAQQRLESDPLLYQKYVANGYKLPKGKDPRVTALGKVLRALSLDELPQLFNVLKGDMSLVGPRPIVPPELAEYGEYGALFLSVKPGLTGNWQVNGRSAIVDYTRRAALDIEYIRDQSIKTDLNILLRTIPAVLRRKGAH
jgi:exopolysaccharide production protein ExoY